MKTNKCVASAEGREEAFSTEDEEEEEEMEVGRREWGGGLIHNSEASRRYEGKEMHLSALRQRCPAVASPSWVVGFPDFNAAPYQPRSGCG